MHIYIYTYILPEDVYIKHMYTYTGDIHIYTYMGAKVQVCVVTSRYVGATMSMLLQIIGLFCKRALLMKQYSVEETYNFKEPTNRNHPTCG